MAKNSVLRVDRNLARRLREARREVGYSTRKVAVNMPTKLVVSHATIASYENGATVPPIDVLAALADIYRRPLNWFLESRESLGTFRYRNLPSRVPLHEQRQFEAVAGKWAEAYLSLSKHLHVRHPFSPKAIAEQEPLTPEALAEAVRKKCLEISDQQPIQSVVGVLESFSAWAFEIRTSFGVESAAARHGDEFVVVMNPEVANDRARMNAAHELAHLLYDAHKAPCGWSDNEVEKKAYIFASSLILPDSQLRAAFDGKSFLRLVQFKEKFGISIAAMIYRAEKAKIINTSTSRWLWSEMIRRHWRENEPGYVWKDRAIGFETMLECAIHKKSLSWEDAERITGVKEAELRQRLISATAVQERKEGAGAERDVLPLLGKTGG